LDNLIIGDLSHQPAANGRHVTGIYRCSVMLPKYDFEGAFPTVRHGQPESQGQDHVAYGFSKP
jgi:hypothetical protein